MNALQFIHHMGVIPMSVEKPCKHPTNSELRRWLNQKAIQINHTTPKAIDEISFPVTQFVFFPNSKRRTTVL